MEMSAPIEELDTHVGTPAEQLAPHVPELPYGQPLSDRVAPFTDTAPGAQAEYIDLPLEDLQLPLAAPTAAPAVVPVPVAPYEPVRLQPQPTMASPAQPLSVPPPIVEPPKPFPQPALAWTPVAQTFSPPTVTASPLPTQPAPVQTAVQVTPIAAPPMPAPIQMESHQNRPRTVVEPLHAFSASPLSALDADTLATAPTPEAIRDIVMPSVLPPEITGEKPVRMYSQNSQKVWGARRANRVWYAVLCTFLSLCLVGALVYWLSIGAPTDVQDIPLLHMTNG